MRRHNPPLISGAEMTRILVAGVSIPIEESTGMLEEIIAEVKAREVVADGHRPRVMVIGAEVDDDAFIKLIVTAVPVWSLMTCALVPESTGLM